MNSINKKNYYILGLQSYASHDSGASILKFSQGNKPEIVSISEERLSRKKYNYSFSHFINKVLYGLFWNKGFIQN